MGSCNVARDFRQGSIGLSFELEAGIGDANRMGSTMPFPHKACAWLDPWSRLGCDPPVSFEFVRQGHQPPLRDLGKTAKGDFLHAIRDSPHHDVAAQPRRLDPKQPPPFEAQVPEAKTWQCPEPIWVASLGI